jgi:hypothetical protein
MQRRVYAVVAALLTLARHAGAAPASNYYLTAGDQFTNIVISGDSYTQFAQQSFEYPIAVDGTIRTSGNFSGPGSEYSLSGLYLGTGGAWNAPPSIYDGTTDGQFNYAVDLGDSGVYQFAVDWSGPTLLFANAPDFLGITYDPSDDSFWLANWWTNVIEHRDRSGNVLGSFNADHFHRYLTALALDPADGTLWVGSQDARGEFAQYSRSGTLLSTASYGFGYNVLGGEFEYTGTVVPEPSAGLLLLLGLSALARVRSSCVKSLVRY